MIQFAWPQLSALVLTGGSVSECNHAPMRACVLWCVVAGGAIAHSSIAETPATIQVADQEFAPSGSRTPLKLNRDLLWPRGGGRITFLVHSETEDRFAATSIGQLAKVAGEFGGMPVDLLEPGDSGFVDFAFTPLAKCACPDQPVIPTTSYVDVTLLRSDVSYFGWSRTVQLDSPCAVHQVYQIVVNLRAIKSNRFLGLTTTRLETRDLVHEYGHLLGLCSASDHCYAAANTVARHCRQSSCAMSAPTAKAKTYALFHTGIFGHNVDDYCALCKRDIARAKAEWTQVLGD